MENNEFNLYNLGYAGSEYYKKQNKLDEEAQKTLNQYTAKIIQESQAKENEAKNIAEAAARNAYATKYARSAERVKSLQEEIDYNENASIIGMTEMVANVVEKGLLLDESEFAKLCPTYKKDIRDIVSGFLRESEINENITNKDTLTLMEYVYKTLPDVKEGKKLTEDAIENLISNQKNMDVDSAINRLSGNVGKHVANLMEKEQKRVDEINAENDKAAAGEQQAAQPQVAPADPNEVIQALLAGEITPEDVDAMAQNGELDENSYNQIVSAYEASAQEQGQDGAGLTPKKQIQMTPDGTLNINIFEAAQPDKVEEAAPKAQIQINADGTLVASDANKQVVVGQDGELQIDIMEAIEYSVKNYYEYEDYLQEGIVTDFDLGKWSPEMEIEKKYTQKGRVFGTIIGWFFGGVIGAFLKVLFPGGGSIMKKIGVALANAIKGSQASTEAAVDTVAKAGNSTAGVGGAVVGGALIGGAVGHYVGRKINAKINRKKIKALIELCSKDEHCNKIIGDMQKAIENEDTETLKKLREQFALRLDELKNIVTVNNGFAYKQDAPKYSTVYTEGLIRETPRCGLIESLAVNEARQMIKEGKEYDADYCLAKAIMYVTITEAMNDMGLMTMDKAAYNKIISAAGGQLIETVPVEFKGGTVVRKGATELEKFKKANENAKADEAKQNRKKTIVQESILVSQFNDPVYNSGNSGTLSLAEKLRQKRLQEQQVINE